MHLIIVLSNGTEIDAGYVGVVITPTPDPEPEPEYYTVFFVDHTGSPIMSTEVKHGEAADAPAVPSRPGYVFAGWDKDFSNVTSDLTVTATYIQITDPTIVISNEIGAAGSEVTVTFDLINSPSLYAMSLKLYFDDAAMELISATSGDAVSPFSYTAPSRLKNGCNFMWYANDPATANGNV